MNEEDKRRRHPMYVQSLCDVLVAHGVAPATVQPIRDWAAAKAREALRELESPAVVGPDPEAS